MRQVGHTGTLDPFATGALVVACGAATKAIQFLDEGSKTYHAVVKLGESTDTQDTTGKILQTRSCSGIDKETIKKMLERFVGHSEQLPPMYSALKIDGVRLYALARKGVEVDRDLRPITVHSLRLLDSALPAITFEVTCSRGTYVRTLVHDMGEFLGCGAHLTELRRISSGSFTLESATTMQQLAESSLRDVPRISIDEALRHLPALTLDAATAQRVKNGLLPAMFLRGVAPSPLPVRLYGFEGELLAVAEFKSAPEGTAGRLLRVFPELSSLQK